MRRARSARRFKASASAVPAPPKPPGTASWLSSAFCSAARCAAASSARRDFAAQRLQGRHAFARHRGGLRGGRRQGGSHRARQPNPSALRAGVGSRRGRRRTPHRAVLDQPQPVGDQLDQMPIMADKHHGAGIVGERGDQASRVSMSRWLVGSSRISNAGASWVTSARLSRARSPPDSEDPVQTPCPGRSRNSRAGCGPPRPLSVRQQRCEMIVGGFVGSQLVDLVLGKEPGNSASTAG